MPTQPPPSSPSPSPARPRRWLLMGVGAGIVVAALAGAFLLGRGQGDDAPAPAPSSHEAAAIGATPDIRLQPVAGVLLPFSTLHGPRITSDGRAAGYSDSELGAAVAAVQVLARTSPSAGSNIFEPVLASQVTGTNLPAMKLAISDEYQQLRASTPVDDGEPIPGNDATVAGFVVRSYDDTKTGIDVVLKSSQLSDQGQLVSFAVNLLWQDDDWRVIAPPNGDWGSVATTLGDPPPGLRRYDL